MLMGLVLCMVLFGGVAFLTRMNNTQHDWAPNDIYSSVGGSSYSTANVTASSAPTSGVTFPLQRGRSVSRSMRSSRAASSYAPAHYSSIAHTQYPIGGTPSNSVASPLYTTSSATMKSFGGGNSAGVSMSGGTVRNDNSATSVASANIAYAPLPAISVPYTYVYTPDESQAVAASVYSGAPAMVNDRYPFSSYSSQIAYNATNTATSLLGNPIGLRGRLNGAPTFNDPWWIWFDSYVSQNGEDYGIGENNYAFDEKTLHDVYQEFITSYWNSGMGDAPSFDQWLDWYKDAMQNNGYYTFNENPYWWTPVGDIAPLFILVLLYVIVVIIRRKIILTINIK